jgi:hypothetical protein
LAKYASDPTIVAIRSSSLIHVDVSALATVHQGVRR